MSIDDAEAKRIAAHLISDAWQDAANQDASSEVFASTALSAALASLVKTHGREAAARMAERFAESVRSGKFSNP